MTSSKMSSAPCVGEGAEAFEEAGRGRDGAGVADDGLDDDAGDLVGVGGEGGLDGGEIVVGQGEGELRGFFGDAGGAGDAEGGDAGAGFDQQRVGVAVVAAFELDDEVAAGEAAGEADGGHAGLGAGADEAHLLDGREAALDELGEVGFAGVGGAEAGAAARRPRWMASTTGGKAWPRIMGPQEPK